MAVYDQLVAHDVVSFDLFDTLVMRDIALADVQRKTSDFADAFVRADNGPLPKGLLFNTRNLLQQEQQRRCVLETGGSRNEIVLAEVFDAALAPYLSDDTARADAVAALVAYEVATEKSVLIVNADMLALLVRLKSAGRRLILISDMYLAAAHIDDILQSLGLAEFFDHVFVSSRVGLTKKSGAMFAHVDQVLGLDGTTRIHVGDNLNNDVDQPRLMGWEALHYVHPGHEKRRAELDIAARLGTATHGRAFRALLADYGTGGKPGLEHLAAAGFAIFARRILSRAVQGRFDRVLFLTRDGTRFRDAITTFLHDQWPGGTKVCPPLGDMAFSRRMALLLNYPEMDDDDWQGYLIHSVLSLNRTPLSIRTIMRSFGIAAAELENLSPDRRAEVDGYLQGDDPATDLGFDQLLAREDLLMPLHLALVARRQRIKTYLDQLGLFDRDERILLVDIGYSGTAMKSISQYMFAHEAEGRAVTSKLEVLLLAANRHHGWNLGQLHPRVTMHPGELIGTDDWRHRAAAVNFAWLEPFAADSTRGVLLDYTRDSSGRMQPVFARPPTRPDNRAISEQMAQYEHALRRSSLPAAEADRRMTAYWIGQVIQPGRSTINGIRAYRHQIGHADTVALDVMRPIRPHRLIGDIFHCIETDGWLQGSLRRSGFGLITGLVNRIAGLEAK